MFQYAMGRSVADQCGLPLVLDTSLFYTHRPKMTKREYELHHFNVRAEVRQWDPYGFRFNSALLRKASRILCNGLHLAPPLYRENVGHLDVNNRDGLCIEGYFQSEKWFVENRERIRQDFTFVAEPSKEDQQILDAIGRAQVSVSLHVRRGDYLTHPTAATLHGVCDIAYYRKALQHLASCIGNLDLFVFSDEPDWCRAELNLGFPMQVIGHNTGMNSFADLRLMSACKHHIIANSSFSWWGAWLGNHSYQIVVAPAQWFADPNKNLVTRDLVPSSWLRL